MANPDLGLGLGQTAPAGSARGGLNPSTAPSRRAPRLAKRRHSAASSRSRSPLAPAPPWNPFGPASGGCTDGLEKGATAAKDVPAGNSKLGGGDGDGVGNFGMGKGQSAGFAFCSLESAEGLSSEHATSFVTPFVFGSDSNSLPRFEHGLSSLKLPDKIRKLNLRNSHKGGDVGKKLEQKDEAGKDGRTPFGVDVSSLVRDSEANVHPEKMTQLNIGNVAPLGGVGSGGANHAPEVFAFGSNTASACVNTRNDSTSGVNASAPGSIHGTEANALLEKMTQLNIGNEAPLQGIGGEDANCASEVFVFGSNTTSGPVNSRNASGAKAYASNSVRDTVANVSAEKMTQLNIGNGTPLQGTGSEGANHGPEVLVFGSNTASGCIDSGNNAAYDANASACNSVHGTEANVLPEKMTQLNKVGATPLQGMKSENANCIPETFVFGRNGTTGFISGQAASRVVDNDSDFVSGAKAKAFTSAHVTEVNILPEKMTELHIGCGMLSHSLESETTNRPPEVFVFGSGETTSFFSGQTASTPSTSFSTNMSSELLNNRRDMTNENLRNPTSFRVDVDNGYGQSIFIFGSGRNTATQFEGAAAHDLHEGTNKLNISREGISVGCNKVNDSSSLQFSFQSKPETISQYGSLPHPKVQGPCDPVTPLNSSSSFHTFQNGVPDSSFRTMHTGSETAPTEFGAVKQDPSMCSTESLFGLEHIKSSYQDKKGECKSTRKNKRPTRLKHRRKLHQSVSQEAYTNQPDLELPGEYSSMDCSPCPASAEQVSIEAYVTSNESSHTNRGSVSNQNSSCVKDVVSTTEHSVVDGDLPACKDEGRVYNGGAIENIFVICLSRFDGETNICSTSQPCFGNANVGSDGKTRTGTTEVEADSYGYNVDGQIREENTNETAHKFGEPFTFQSSPANFNGLKFTFSSSLSSKSSSSVQRRSSRRKLRMKGGQASQGSATNTSLQPSTSQNANNVQLFPETRKTEDSRKEQAAADASISAALEMCNTWRTSGNQAFANGHFATAEEYYTRGINFISHHGTSGRCSHSLMLCYSNRAATRMSLGRMREAVQDCLFATSIDPSFLKAKVRAGNCQLALGYLEDASKSYAECLKSNSFSCSNHKMLAEASHGLERVKRVADWVSQSKELLKKRTFTDSTLALDLISNALYISSHSDNLMEMKTQALLMLRRYEEVIQLCEETVDLVERNSVLFSGNGELKNDSISDTTECSARLWRSYLICKSYFLLGKLEEALNLLKKHEQLTPAKESHGSMSPECFSSLSATITQLLRLKVAGNESFQAGRYSEAVEQYSAALASNSESRSFSAICFCNRAAAYQALGRVTDAIADCSLAMVLDANYPKAISRRATLYEVIRDYGQAANDLRKLISVLERQVTQSGVSSKCGNKHSDLKQVCGRLSSLEDEARKDTPLNMYLILGVEPSCSATDVKKAYRKAALRHHPDKAAQLLVRNDSADDGFWRDVAKEVHTDADHLFKTIGEAYNVLSDADKRQEYDTEEQLRNDLKRSFKGRNVHKSPEQQYSKQYDRGFSPRWQSNRSASRPRWPGYGYSDDFW